MCKTKRLLSAILAVLLLCGYAVLVPASAEAEGSSLVISASTNRVHRNRTLQLTVNTNQPVVWTSSDDSVASVSNSGLVLGVEIGTVVITATTTDKSQSADYTVYVVRRSSAWRNLLEKYPILGYRYSYDGDYFYTDDQNCWQKNFGFNFAYDWVAPLMWMEYDFVRVFLPYDGKDWMIQMWKGQYGLIFYGAEVGVYYREQGKKSATPYSHYKAAYDQDYIKIGNKLYRYNEDTNEYDFEFEHPYTTHWWNAAFVPGHLLRTTRCEELRTVSHITLKDAEMAKLFTDGLQEQGFTAVDSMDKIQSETFFRDGADIYLQWQHRTEATATHTPSNFSWSLVAVFGLLILLFVGLFMMIFSLLFGGILFFIVLI